MNDALSQTSAKLDLQPGQCQVFQVDGYRLEIRRPADEESDYSGMTMLEPWVAFPEGEPAMHLAVRIEPHPLPVPPDIPADENVVHLAKHFADGFSRIGLPRPFETM